MAVTSTTSGPFLGPVGTLLVELGAVAGALLVVLGLVWRVARPHVRAFVAEQSAAARQLQPDHGSSTHDRVTQLVDGLQRVDARLDALAGQLDGHDGRLVELERQLTEHLRHAATELSMLRAVCAAAGIELVPRPVAAPRRRWYDDADPSVTSWEVRRAPAGDA